MLGQLQPIALLNAIHSACDDITSVLKVTVVGFVNCDVTEHWWIQMLDTVEAALVEGGGIFSETFTLWLLV